MAVTIWTGFWITGNVYLQPNLGISDSSNHVHIQMRMLLSSERTSYSWGRFRFISPTFILPILCHFPYSAKQQIVKDTGLACTHWYFGVIINLGFTKFTVILSKHGVHHQKCMCSFIDLPNSINQRGRWKHDHHKWNVIARCPKSRSYSGGVTTFHGW